LPSAPPKLEDKPTAKKSAEKSAAEPLAPGSHAPAPA
jgi:hypothetical protein